MAIPLLICDDSLMARKQMLRALPTDWNVEVSYARDGKECLEQLAEGKGDILFLDLNMPVLDGYGVLQAIRQQDLPTLVIVVSGDIQPQAQRRVCELGAITLIKKPAVPDDLRRLLTEFGLYTAATEGQLHTQTTEGEVSWQEVLQEQANVAMGQAGDLLARLLGAFVELAVPRVNTMESNELRMALSVGGNQDKWSGVCQGFVGSGLAGEALLLFSDSSIEDMADLLGYTEDEAQNTDIEVLMDLSGILAGAFLKGLARQLNFDLGVSHPVVLGTHVQVDDLLHQNSQYWQKTLAIELSYAVEGRDILGNLLLLFTEQSIPRLQERLEYLKDN